MTFIEAAPSLALCHVALEWAVGEYHKVSHGGHPTELFVPSGLIGDANRLIHESETDEVNKLHVHVWLGLERDSWFVVGPCAIIASTIL